MSSSFTSPLWVTPLPGGRRWKLLRSFSYHIGSKKSRHIIKVPKGFITDFASTDVLQGVAVTLILIYAIFMRILPDWAGYIFLLIILLAILITPYGKQGKGAVLHDYLYHTRQVSRAMSDLIFYEAMKVGGTGKWKARLMYLGVRLFGFGIWHRKRIKR